MKRVKINNVTPNGSKIDIFSLKEIEGSGKDRKEYDIVFQHLEFLNKYYFGKVIMNDGTLVFYNDKGEEITEMRLSALKLLCEWIDKHREYEDDK